MNLDLEDIAKFTQIAKPIIDPIVNSLVKPHIDRLNRWVIKKDAKQKVESNFWENKFYNYLEELYRSSLYVTTLVFPNSQTKLKQLYVPLTLVRPGTAERYKVEEFDFSLFEKYSKIIISDYAGMGKSTILKWITISIVEQQKSVPVLIELRKIDDKNSLIDEIFNQISPLDKSFDKDLIYSLLNLGFFTILLDGFDEIPYDLQDKVTSQLATFIKKAERITLY